MLDETLRQVFIVVTHLWNGWAKHSEAARHARVPSVLPEDQPFGMLLANGCEMIRPSVEHIFSAVFNRERNPPQRNSELRIMKAVHDLPNAGFTDVRPRVPIPSVVVPSGVESSRLQSQLFELRYGPDNLRGCEFELVTPSAPVRLVVRRYWMRWSPSLAPESFRIKA